MRCSLIPPLSYDSTIFFFLINSFEHYVIDIVCRQFEKIIIILDLNIVRKRMHKINWPGICVIETRISLFCISIIIIKNLASCRVSTLVSLGRLATRVDTWQSSFLWLWRLIRARFCSNVAEEGKAGRHCYWHSFILLYKKGLVTCMWIIGMDRIFIKLINKQT